ESERSPFLRGVAALNARLGAPIVLLAAAVLGVSVWGMTKIEVETKFISYFKSGTDLYRGLDFIDNRLGGTTTVEVVYQAPREAPEGHFLSREGFADLRRMQERLDSIREIGKVMSVVNWAEEFEKLADSLPRTLLDFLLGKDVPREERGLRALRLLLGRAAPGEGNPMLRAMTEQAGMKGRLETLLRNFATADFRKARIFTRARETAETLRRNDVITGLRRFLEEHPPAAKARADVTGIFVLYTNMLNSLMVSQVSTFGLVFVSIFLMLALLFRSWGIALLGMVPNVLPIAFVLGLLGWTGIPLDMATVMIASVAIGIGVDATIHYLFRYQREWAADRDYVAAMRRSHESVGQATLYTTIAVVGGFWILVLSNFKPMIYFGVLTGAAMLAALAASLTVLPVLVMWTKPFGKTPPAPPPA
ncbi:MAG: MMPL family transporter, partial [Planctomycetales bacterium]|nr:MMPL family transporter [Planctomycetales bacterium]